MGAVIMCEKHYKRKRAMLSSASSEHMRKDWDEMYAEMSEIEVDAKGRPAGGPSSWWPRAPSGSATSAQAALSLWATEDQPVRGHHAGG